MLLQGVLLAAAAGGCIPSSDPPAGPPGSTPGDLASLIVSAGALSPAFDPAVTSYAVLVPNATTSTTVTATAAERLAKISINNQVATPGQPFGPIDLAVGTTTLTIVVDGPGFNKTYTIVITRAAAAIADLAPGHSLVAALQGAGLRRLFVTDWRSAAPEMRFLTIDNYLADLNVLVDQLGEAVDLIGLCQGGWMALVYAARFPAKVRKLVLAGAPIDIAAGKSAFERVEDGYLRRAGAISLTGGCINCHGGFSPTLSSSAKFAGLVISVPIGDDESGGLLESEESK